MRSPQKFRGGVGALPRAGAHAVRQTRWVGQAEQRGMQSAKMCMPEKSPPITHTSICQPHSVHHSPISHNPFRQGRHPLFVARVSKTHARHLLRAVETGPAAYPYQTPKTLRPPTLSLYLCIDFAHARKLESSFLFAQVFRALWTTIKEINRHAGKGVLLLGQG